MNNRATNGADVRALCSVNRDGTAMTVSEKAVNCGREFAVDKLEVEPLERLPWL